MKQLAHCLLLINRNSPLSLRLKNNTTLGRPGQDFLRVSKFRDFNYYEQKHHEDKINSLSEEVREKIKKPVNWQRSPFVQVPHLGLKKEKSIAKQLIEVVNPEQNFPFLEIFDNNYHEGTCSFDS
jgi:hypothetical protein